MSPSARRIRPILALVLVVMATAACGISTASTPTIIPRANVPFDLLNPRLPGNVTPVSTTVPPAVAAPEEIYLVAPSQHVIAVSRDVQLPATLTDILGALLEGPTSAESSAGLQSFLTGTNTQVSASVAGGVATVDFTGNPVQVVGPNQTLAIAQVVFTVTQQAGVTGVLFEIAGKPTDVPTASGAQVPGPVDRTSYLPQAPTP